MMAHEIFGIGLAFVLLYVTLIWLLSLGLRDASIMDIFWGIGFVFLNAVYFALTNGALERKILLTALVTLWGARLSAHIFFRNLKRGEDFRYQAWRKNAGKNFWWISFFQVFLLQGALIGLLSTPLLAAHLSATPAQLTLMDALGFGTWLFGFAFESIADWQLMRFKTNPANRGKVLNAGLWSLSRHPNYFGEAVLWWGFFLIALATPNGWLTIYAPALMTFLLMRVSGVTLLEKTLTQTKAGYAEYIARTPAFLPRLRK